MIELFGALVAGVLTTLAPCVLPLLPIIVGGSMAGRLPRSVRSPVPVPSPGAPPRSRP